MSIQIVYKCDWCGKRIPDGEGMLLEMVGLGENYYKGHGFGRGPRQEKQVCKKHLSKLTERARSKSDG